MTPKEREVMEQALEALESCDSDYDWDGDGDEYQVDVYDRDKVNKAITTIKEALAQPEQEPVAGEPAPENSLPTWSDCNLIIKNDEFRKRAEAGLEGQVLDTPRTTPKPTALHYFIHEYDDADPYRSAWFLHRLECVLKEATTPPPVTETHKRTWAGIDDEEIRQTDHHMVEGAYHHSFKQGVRWAEAKLKEKNNGTR